MSHRSRIEVELVVGEGVGMGMGAHVGPCGVAGSVVVPVRVEVVVPALAVSDVVQ